MGGEIVAVTGSQSPALLSSARRSVLDRATAPQSSALRNPDTRWGSRGDLRPLMGAEVVTPEEPHPYRKAARRGCGEAAYLLDFWDRACALATLRRRHRSHGSRRSATRAGQANPGSTSGCAMLGGVPVRAYCQAESLLERRTSDGRRTSRPRSVSRHFSNSIRSWCTSSTRLCIVFSPSCSRS